MKLSIIVPVYQVEQYIRTCVESIFQQGIPDADSVMARPEACPITLEVILVDDGTKDNSFGQIADLIATHKNIIVVRQPNRGLSAARNAGLAKATGDYVLFLDSDDLLVPFSLAPLLREAGKQKPDMVIAGFVKLNDDDIREGFVPTETEATFSDTTGEEFFLGPFNPRECYVWHTLYRKDFLDANNLRFIEGIYFEDVPFTTECYLKAGRCLYTPQPIYIYRQHSGSICSTITMPKILDINRVLAFLWKLYCQTQDSRIKAQLMNTIFDNFCVETWFITHNKQLLAGRREFITDLLQRIPDLHFTGGLKARLISCLFRLMPNTYLWLRSL